jgi:hypothetical protein
MSLWPSMQPDPDLGPDGMADGPAELTPDRPARSSSGSAGRGAPAVTREELLAIAAITLAAAVIRFAYVASGGNWDMDQGTEMMALWTAISTGQLPLYGPAASLGSSFHHGAIYYDLLLPAAWLSHGDPRVVVAEIAAWNVTVVPILWWVARSIGGRAGGLIVAVMAATSADLVFFSTFIWNPTLIEPGLALGLLGTWQAWQTENPRWWLAAGAGVMLAAQAHVAAAVVVLPLGLVFLLDLRRGPAGSRRRIGLWGLAGLGVLAATYLPVASHEISNGFPEARGIISYVSSPPGGVTVGPLARLIFAAIRLPAWPLTGWPYFEREPGLVIAFAAALAMAVVLPILILRVWRHGGTVSGGESEALDERDGVALVAGGLGLIVLALGLGLRAVSELNTSMTEQYHMAADPFVLIGAATALASVWYVRRVGRFSRPGRPIVALVLVGFVAYNAAQWPAVGGGGNWTDAQAAAAQIERDAAGGPIALVSLYEPATADAYAYPLLRDRVQLVGTSDAPTVVLLCDTDWLKGCGGSAEDSWMAARPAVGGLTLVDRIWAAPNRVLSVYRRSPEVWANSSR